MSSATNNTLLNHYRRDNTHPVFYSFDIEIGI